MINILTNKDKSKTNMKKRKQNIFLFCMLVFPVAQFCVFYIGVNFNSILLAFKSYDYFGNATPVGLKNFVDFFSDAFNDLAMITRVKNSAIQYLVSLVISTPLNIVVSYCVWRKVPWGGFFKFILFLPSMISSIVFVLIFKYLAEFAIPIVLGTPDMDSLITSINTGFWTVLIYGIWIGFAGGLILYLGAMSRIPNDVVEYAALDGMGALREFWYIVVPHIFPTITTFLVVGVAHFFSNYGHFYSFYSVEAPVAFQTLGYYFFIKVLNMETYVEYPYAAAAGLSFTLIAAPITLMVKWALEKFGPSED